MLALHAHGYDVVPEPEGGWPSAKEAPNEAFSRLFKPFEGF